MGFFKFSLNLLNPLKKNIYTVFTFGKLIRTVVSVSDSPTPAEWGGGSKVLSDKQRSAKCRRKALL